MALVAKKLGLVKTKLGCDLCVSFVLLFSDVVEFDQSVVPIIKTIIVEKKNWDW